MVSNESTMLLVSSSAVEEDVGWELCRRGERLEQEEEQRGRSRKIKSILVKRNLAHK